MILIIDNDKARRLEERVRFFRRFAISSCGSSFADWERAFEEFHIDGIYIPHVEEADDPVGFCRALKQAHPNIPLVTPVRREECTLDLDALYAVTDNIPVYPLTFVQMGEIMCELQRMYTKRDFLEMHYNSLMISIYTRTGIFGMCRFDLTIHEHAILRYLWIAMPRHVTALELAKAACCPTRNHTEKYVLNLIESINMKSRYIAGSDIVALDEGLGYRLGPEKPRK